MYRDIAAQDPEGVLQHEWLNVRGAVARFIRNAIEIRVIDVQECPHADLAIAAVVCNVVHALSDPRTASLAEQQAIGTDNLVKILRDCIWDAEQARIIDPNYLALLGLPVPQCEARELWKHLIATMLPHETLQPGQNALTVILEQGTLARRILRAVGQDLSRARLQAVYRELCDCLEEGRQFFRVS
jgi:glutamate---cysteine ligase / carboxylate-amine ligase